MKTKTEVAKDLCQQCVNGSISLGDVDRRLEEEFPDTTPKERVILINLAMIHVPRTRYEPCQEELAEELCMLYRDGEISSDDVEWILGRAFPSLDIDGIAKLFNRGMTIPCF